MQQRIDRDDVSGNIKTTLCLLAVSVSGLREQEICQIFARLRSGVPLPLAEWSPLYAQIAVFTRRTGFANMTLASLYLALSSVYLSGSICPG